MPGGHIFNKDGTRMIKVRNTAQTPDALTTAHDTHSNGVSTEAVAGPANTAAATGATGSKKKKKKGRNKGMASHHDSHFDTASHGSHTNNGASHHHHHYHDDFESSKQGPSNKHSQPHSGPNDTSRQHLQEYLEAIRSSLKQFDSNEHLHFEGDGDDIYYTDEEPQFHDHISNGPSMHPADDAEAPTSKKNKKKKKKKAGQGATGAGVIPEVGHGLTAEVSRNSAQKSSRDRIWNTSTSEERERIKSFWLGLGEEERRSLVKVEKEAVLKKMKEQQKHSCSCSVCGRKRTAIEEELEVLYDAYYEELEHPKGLPSPHRRIDELSEIDDDEEHYETDEEYEDISEDSHRNVQQDFFNFGNSLTVRGGILTVADDLLKNDGKKFIEMMEQLAERRMAREEEASQHSHNLGGQLHSGMQHNHSHMPNGNQEYDIEEEDEDYDDDEEDYEDDEDEEPDTMTEEQRMEEGRRMFQIFAARMFEQRVLSAYREEVAKERQNKLLEELEAEKVKEQQALERKARQQEKKKDKKKALKEQKENDRKEKEARKAEEEAAQRAEEERKAEEARRRKEEQRLKREAEKKAAEEERLRKEEERKKRLQEEKEREQERERKRREQQERERKKKEEQTRKLKEEKEQRDREKREKDERDRKDRDTRRKAAEDKERELKEQRDQKERERERDRAGNPSGSSSVVIPKIATTPILATTTTMAASSPLLHNLHPPAIVPAVVSPRLAVATPALPKHTSPGKGKSSASARGSVASSPQTPKIQLRAHTTAANVPLNSSSMAAASSAIPQAVQLPTNPPPGLLPPGVTVSPGNVGKRGLGQPATNPLQSAIQPISNHVSQIPPAPGLSPGAPMTTIHGGFPTHIAPPPGVPHPDPFSMSIPNQAPFVSHGHRPPQSPFPPQPFGMANTYRGFPGVHNMNPPPLVPPPGGLRNDFPPGGRGIFGGGDFSSLQQPMPASSFPVAPGSPFMRQENVVPTGHHRHPSNESNEIHHSVSTPKPIHRPTPIQRPPSHLVARDPISKANIDELSTSLGSSALLGDDDEPIDYRDNQLPIRRASIIGQGRAAGFAMPSGPSSFFPPESRHSPFGGLPSPSTHAPQMNTWGTASSPLFSSNAVTAWGSPSSGPGWGDPRVLHGHHNRRPTRIDTLRILAIRAITNVGPPTKDPEGYVSVEDMHRLLVDSGEVTVGLGLSDEELATVTEVEGDHVNGNGYFGHRRDDNGKITRVSFVAGDIRRRVSSAAGLVGTPVIKPAPLLPFEQRINPNLLEDEAL